RHGIVDRGMHPLPFEGVADAVTPVHVRYEQMVDALAARVVLREADATAGKPFAIDADDLEPAPAPFLEMPELHAKHGALKSVHAIVPADPPVVVAARLPVIAEGSHHVGDAV